MKRLFVLILHALVGWVFCAAVMGVGTAVASLQTTLWIHAISAPLIFGVITFAYFSRQSYIDPLILAIVFLGVVLMLDLVVVSYLLIGSLEMFQSLLGTWVPLGLIFLSTYLVGLYATRQLPRKLDIFS